MWLHSPIFVNRGGFLASGSFGLLLNTGCFINRLSDPYSKI